jgi:hypothetical protein
MHLIEGSQKARIPSGVISAMENQALIKGVSIEFNAGENLPMLTMDRNQIQSVVINLIINALDAMEQGGTIAISTGISLSASDTGKWVLRLLLLITDVVYHRKISMNCSNLSSPLKKWARVRGLVWLFHTGSYRDMAAPSGCKARLEGEALLLSGFP